MARISSVDRLEGIVSESELGGWNRVGYACSEEDQEAIS